MTGDTKVMVALGGWTWSHNFAAVAANKTKRGVFAESVKGFLDEWKLDGIGEYTRVRVRTGKSVGLTRLTWMVIDIDWEYPTDPRVNGTLEGMFPIPFCHPFLGRLLTPRTFNLDFDVRRADKENFVRLMKELRESIGPEKVISLAVSASTIISPEKNNQSLIQAGIDVKLADYVDMFNVMGYVGLATAQCIV